LTLYTTPVIYIFFDRLAQRFSRKKKNEESESPDISEANPAPGI
jgi:multidrug efflux pump